MLRSTVLATTVAAVLAGATAPTAFATTIHVNTEADAVANDGHCSLREAITNVNSGQGSFLGAGECAPGSGGDTVLLPAGHFVLSRAGKGENMNATGDLDIFFPESTTIAGAGAGATTIDANGVDRVLHVLAGTVTVRKLKITGGHPADGANGQDATSNLMNPTGGSGGNGEPGGGILNDADLTIEDSVIAGNHAGDGGNGGSALGPDGEGGASGTIGFSATGGVPGWGGNGGGIATTHSLTLIRSVMTGNVAGSGGDGGSATGGDGGNAASSISGDGGAARGGVGASGGNGGAIHSDFGTSVDIDASSISGNSAGTGGSGGFGQAGSGGDGASGATSAGIGANGRGENGGSGGSGGGLNTQGPLTITRSLVSANHAGNGGAGGNGFGGDGGDMGTVNKSAGKGGNGIGGYGGGGGSAGGILAFTETLTIVNTTVAGNATGAGSHAGAGTGGDGGSGGTVLSPNGSGGDGTGGLGGSGGSGGGLLTTTLTGQLRHATVSGNQLGAGDAGGAGVGGQPGSGPLPSGSAGTSTNGPAGHKSQAGGIFALPFPAPPGPPGSPPPLRVFNSIVAGNDQPSCVGNGFGDGGHNISYPDASCPGAPVNPLLKPLADNGGLTQTQAIAPGSPALDSVPARDGNCAETDQRGVTRPRLQACDAGAFEYALQEATTGDATGVSDTGATLTGQVVPNGNPTSYRFDYGTTEAYGTSTAPQDAGHGVSGVPAAAGVGGLTPDTTYHYRLVATSPAGNVTGGDRTFTTPAGPDAAPVLLSASLRPKRFAVKRGATFRYRLSEAATVTFAIQRALGRRGWGKARRFRVRSKAGANRRRFSGRIGRKRLKPGRYRATLVARDAAGNASQPERLKFRVVRG